MGIDIRKSRVSFEFEEFENLGILRDTSMIQHTLSSTRREYFFLYTNFLRYFYVLTTQ